MATNIYPRTKVSPDTQDYTVTVNGEKVLLHTARVSAVPFNRRWPGHQREADQTELVNFLPFETDEPVRFEIRPKEKFDRVEIRPKSLGITYTVTDGVICFTLPKPAYFTVEPYDRKKALHIFADPIKDYGIKEGDENVLYFGKGVHEAGVIELCDNQTLYLDKGAVVYASVFAKDAKNIRILGRGILDNSHNKEEILFPVSAEGNYAAVKNARRRHTVMLEYCENICIDGITIRDSLVYNIRPVACNNLQVRNVKIIGCWRYNSDGIDMHNCQDVLIENSFLRTFDDCICAKGFDCFCEGDVEEAVKKAMYRGGKNYDTFKNLKVRDCVLWNDWGKCLEIGAETRAEEMYDITFENCDIIHATGPVLDVCNFDFAHIHHITYQNISVEYDPVTLAPRIQETDGEIYTNPDPEKIPVLIKAHTDFHKEYSAGGTRRGKIDAIAFRDIHLYGNKPPLLEFQGYDEKHKTKDILIQRIYHNDTLLPSLSEESLILGPFTENIRYEAE